MEIERKFLIKTLPDLSVIPYKHITQAYISTDPVIRIRQLDSSFYLCIKSIGELSREEFELPLTHSQYQRLFLKTESHPIEKLRYFIPLEDGLIAELDVYEGNLKGLFTVEVEFLTTDAALSFIPPIWFGEEITYDNRFKNNQLALYGNPLK